ncbi:MULTISPECIES: hypothetical protein [Pseudomonas]|uniref:Uncharacterized protein n=1 Tax=Pseudomonas putida NBRC 14164 TaxID=1211579 RepID=A0ABN5UIQ9_PSEPU|nr:MULTISPECIES: hypothetical protein [Pseudomonas]EKT4463829.1 hypothetical protein [Pseudomonas putida]EKT4556746.1 hypothetical protein [Pseudomonas putida]MCC9007640.1 hypothetical protein [Pseudomonas putida]MCI1036269.1 hypothetical protein [Pseudomonas putida]MCX9139497.1 hypothetical protein [Pseudomonas sp. DCB_PUT]
MSGEMRELLSSLDLQPTVDKVEQGVTLDFAQYSLLRDSADAKLYQLLHKVNRNGNLEPAIRQQSDRDLRTLQDACLRVSHLLQTSCLALRRLQLDFQDQRLAREALESQLAYMQACLRRSLASFDRSA